MLFRSRGDIIQGALTGLFVGVLGGISPWAASAGAAGMSLLNNRANGGKADVFAFISAAISGLTAGYFSSASNQIANLMVNGSNGIFVKATVGVVTGFVYSNHSFVTDKFIELIKGWYKEGR